MRYGILILLALIFVCSEEASSDRRKTPQTAQAVQLTLYHFSTVYPCRSCPVIDRIVAEMFEDTYASQVASGRLEYLPLKMDEPGNRHFVDDYRLTGNCLVLSLFKNGKEESWKVLDRVKGLVAKPPELKEYLRQEIDSTLP